MSVCLSILLTIVGGIIGIYIGAWLALKPFKAIFKEYLHKMLWRR